MTVVMFVLMLSIPVAMVAKGNKLHFVLIALWGFFLGMTPVGPDIAALCNQAGEAIAGSVSQ